MALYFFVSYYWEIAYRNYQPHLKCILQTVAIERKNSQIALLCLLLKKKKRKGEEN